MAIGFRGRDWKRVMATALSTAASYIARDTDTGIADQFEWEANAARALLDTLS